VVNDINLLLILIRQMAALVRRALAEVYTVPLLLVLTVIHSIVNVCIQACSKTAMRTIITTVTVMCVIIHGIHSKIFYLAW